MRKNTKKCENKMKLLSFFAIILFLFFPLFSNAQIIPSCSPDCGYRDLLSLVNNIINWVIMISVPIAAGVFAWAGFIYMTTGVADQKSYAKDMIQKVFLGFVAILAAWIIVTTITNTLLSDKDGFKQAVPVQGVE